MAKIVFLYFLLCVTLAVCKIEKSHELWSNLNKLFGFHLDIGIKSSSLQHDFITEWQKSRSCEPLCQYNSQEDPETNLPENINLPKKGKIIKSLETQNEKKLPKEITPSKPTVKNARQKKQSYKVTRSEINFKQILEHAIFKTDILDKVGYKEHVQHRSNPENQLETPISDSEHGVISRKLTPNSYAQTLKKTNKPLETPVDHKNWKAKKNLPSKPMKETKIRYEPFVSDYERREIYFNIPSTQLENDLEMEPEEKLDSLESPNNQPRKVATDKGVNVIPPRQKPKSATLPTASSITSGINVPTPVNVVRPGIQVNQTSPKPVITPQGENIIPPRQKPKSGTFPTASSVISSINVPSPVNVVRPGIQINHTSPKPVISSQGANVISPRQKPKSGTFPTASSVTSGINAPTPVNVVRPGIQINQTSPKPVTSSHGVNVIPPRQKPKSGTFPTASSVTSGIYVPTPVNVVRPDIQVHQTSPKPVTSSHGVNVIPPRQKPKSGTFPPASSITSDINVTTPVNVVSPGIQINQTSPKPVISSQGTNVITPRQKPKSGTFPTASSVTSGINVRTPVNVVRPGIQINHTSPKPVTSAHGVNVIPPRQKPKSGTFPTASSVTSDINVPTPVNVVRPDIEVNQTSPKPVTSSHGVNVIPPRQKPKSGTFPTASSVTSSINVPSAVNVVRPVIQINQTSPKPVISSQGANVITPRQKPKSGTFPTASSVISSINVPSPVNVVRPGIQINHTSPKPVISSQGANVISPRQKPKSGTFPTASSVTGGINAPTPVNVVRPGIQINQTSPKPVTSSHGVNVIPPRQKPKSGTFPTASSVTSGIYVPTPVNVVRPDIQVHQTSPKPVTSSHGVNVIPPRQKPKSGTFPPASSITSDINVTTPVNVVSPGIQINQTSPKPVISSQGTNVITPRQKPKSGTFPTASSVTSGINVRTPVNVVRPDIEVNQTSPKPVTSSHGVNVIPPRQKPKSGTFPTASSVTSSINVPSAVNVVRPVIQINQTSPKPVISSQGANVITPRQKPKSGTFPTASSLTSSINVPSAVNVVRPVIQINQTSPKPVTSSHGVNVIPPRQKPKSGTFPTASSITSDINVPTPVNVVSPGIQINQTSPKPVTSSQGTNVITPRQKPKSGTFPTASSVTSGINVRTPVNVVRPGIQINHTSPKPVTSAHGVNVIPPRQKPKSGTFPTASSVTSDINVPTPVNVVRPDIEVNQTSPKPITSSHGVNVIPPRQKPKSGTFPTASSLTSSINVPSAVNVVRPVIQINQTSPKPEISSQGANVITPRQKPKSGTFPTASSITSGINVPTPVNVVRPDIQVHQTSPKPVTSSHGVNVIPPRQKPKSGTFPTASSITSDINVPTPVNVVSPGIQINQTSPKPVISSQGTNVITPRQKPKSGTFPTASTVTSGINVRTPVNVVRPGIQINHTSPKPLTSAHGVNEIPPRQKPKLGTFPAAFSVTSGINVPTPVNVVRPDIQVNQTSPKLVISSQGVDVIPPRQKPKSDTFPTAPSIKDDINVPTAVNVVRPGIQVHQTSPKAVISSRGVNEIPPRQKPKSDTFPAPPSVASSINIPTPVNVVRPDIQLNQRSTKLVISSQGEKVIQPRIKPKSGTFPTATSVKSGINVSTPVYVVGPDIQVNQSSPKPVITPQGEKIIPPRQKHKSDTFSTASSITSGINEPTPVNVVSPGIQVNQISPKAVTAHGPANVIPPRQKPKSDTFPTAPSITGDINVPTPVNVVRPDIEVNETSPKLVISSQGVNVISPRQKPKSDTFPTASSITSGINVPAPVNVVRPDIQVNQRSTKLVISSLGVNVILPRQKLKSDTFPTAPSITSSINVPTPVNVVRPDIQFNQRSTKLVISSQGVNVILPRQKPKSDTFPTAPSITSDINVPTPVNVVRSDIQVNRSSPKPVISSQGGNVIPPRQKSKSDTFPTAPSVTSGINIPTPVNVVRPDIQLNQRSTKLVTSSQGVNVVPPRQKPKSDKFPTAPSITGDINEPTPVNVVRPHIEVNQTSPKLATSSQGVNVVPPRQKPKSDTFPTAPSITGDINVPTPVNVVSPGIQVNQSSPKLVISSQGVNAIPPRPKSVTNTFPTESSMTSGINVPTTVNVVRSDIQVNRTSPKPVISSQGVNVLPPRQKPKSDTFPTAPSVTSGINIPTTVNVVRPDIEVNQTSPKLVVSSQGVNVIPPRQKPKSDKFPTAPSITGDINVPTPVNVVRPDIPVNQTSPKSVIHPGPKIISDTFPTAPVIIRGIDIPTPVNVVRPGIQINQKSPKPVIAHGPVNVIPPRQKPKSDTFPTAPSITVDINVPTPVNVVRSDIQLNRTSPKPVISSQGGNVIPPRQKPKSGTFPTAPSITSGINIPTPVNVVRSEIEVNQTSPKLVMSSQVVNVIPPRQKPKPDIFPTSPSITGDINIPTPANVVRPDIQVNQTSPKPVIPHAPVNVIPPWPKIKSVTFPTAPSITRGINIPTPVNVVSPGIQVNQTSPKPVISSQGENVIPPRPKTKSGTFPTAPSITSGINIPTPVNVVRSDTEVDQTSPKPVISSHGVNVIPPLEKPKSDTFPTAPSITGDINIPTPVNVVRPDIQVNQTSRKLVISSQGVNVIPPRPKSITSTFPTESSMTSGINVPTTVNVVRSDIQVNRTSPKPVISSQGVNVIPPRQKPKSDTFPTAPSVTSGINIPTTVNVVRPNIEVHQTSPKLVISSQGVNVVPPRQKPKSDTFPTAPSTTGDINAPTPVNVVRPDIEVNQTSPKLVVSSQGVNVIPPRQKPKSDTFPTAPSITGDINVPTPVNVVRPDIHVNQASPKPVIPPGPKIISDTFPTAPSITVGINVPTPVNVVRSDIEVNQTSPKLVISSQGVNVIPLRRKPKSNTFPTAPSITSGINVPTPVNVFRSDIQLNRTSSKPVISSQGGNVIPPRQKPKSGTFPAAPSITSGINIPTPVNVVRSDTEVNQTSPKLVISSQGVNVIPPRQKPKSDTFPTAPSITGDINIPTPVNVVRPDIQVNQTSPKPVIPHGPVNVIPPRPKIKSGTFPTAPSITSAINVPTPVNVVSPGIQVNQTIPKLVISSQGVNVIPPRPKSITSTFPTASFMTSGINVPTTVNVVMPGIQTNQRTISGSTQLPGNTVLFGKQRPKPHDSVSKSHSSTGDLHKKNGTKNVRSAESYSSKEKLKPKSFVINISEHNNRTHNDVEIIQNGHNIRLNNSYMTENLQKLFDNDTSGAPPISGFTQVNITAIPKNGQLGPENIMDYINYDPTRQANYEVYLKNYKLYAANRNNKNENKVPDSLQIPAGPNYQSRFNTSDNVSKNLTQANGAEITNLNFGDDLEDIADVRALIFGEKLNPKNHYNVKVNKFKFAGDEHGFKSTKLNANVTLSLLNKHHPNLTGGGHLFDGQNLGVRNIDLKGSGIAFNEQPVSKKAKVRLLELKT